MPTEQATFLKRLEASGLLNDSIVAAWPRLTGLQSAEDAADELVRDSLLTEFQSEVLLGDDSIPLVIGDYVVQDMIGQGGMGVVLKARHQRMRRAVAIKFLLKSQAPSKSIERRFEREVQAAAQLDHPHIVTAYDAGVHTDGSYYLVMQYVEGQDLSSLVKKSGPLPVPLAIHAIVQAAEGLGYAHENGIVHRDVKPGNLLLDHVGVVRVLDMGLARIRATPGEEIGDAGHADLTNTGSVMGTIDYMAPEQALDARTADHRADIYGLGCTLYFLLTGNPPYLRDTIMQRLLAHREDEIPRLRVVRPQIPQELDDLVAQMLAKKPADRHVSMRQLIVDVGRLNITATSPDIMETLDQPLSDSEGSSIVFAPANEEFPAEESARPSDSPQPGVAMKPKSSARRRRRGQAELEHPVTEEFNTADTALREKEKRRLREGSQRRSTAKRRKKTAKRKRSENPSKQDQPVLPWAPTLDEGVQAGPKPRRSLKPVLLWLFASSWGVPRVYFAGAGLAAILCVILAVSLGPSSTNTAQLDPNAGTAQPGDVIAPNADGSVAPRPAVVVGDFALDFAAAGAVAEVNGFRLHGESPLTIEARITPRRIEAGTRATILQFAQVARLYIDSNGGTWTLGCSLQNAAGSTVEALSRSEHVFDTEHHVAAVWDLQTLKIYVDGQDERESPSLPDPLSSREGQLRIGLDFDDEMVFQGLLDEIRISNAIRYDAQFTVPRRHRSDEYTVALFHCDEGRDNKLIDSSENKSNAAVDLAEWFLIEEAPGNQAKPVTPVAVNGDGLELQPVRELNSSGIDGYCWLNPNGLTIYFTREGIPKSGIWKASRITIAHQFGVPVFETRARHIALSGDETVAVALMGYEKPAELAESSRRGFRQAPLDNFQAIVRFAGSRSVQSPWLSSNGLTLIFQRIDEQNSYPGGSSPRSSRTEFVISKRAGLEAGWSFPGRLPFGTTPQLTKPLTWPMLTDDGLTLLFCHGAGSDSEVMIATRPTDDARFRNVRTVNIDGKPLVGRAPRYVESTGELFVTQLHAGSTTDWDLFVIRDFEIDKYR